MLKQLFETFLALVIVYGAFIVLGLVFELVTRVEDWVKEKLPLDR